MNHIVKDPLQKRIESSNWITLAIIFILSLFLASTKFSLGVLLGGFISILNFHWMKRGLIGFFQHAGDSAKGRVLIKYYIRLAVTAIVLYFLITNQTVNVIGLIIGLSVVVMNIIVTTIIALAKKNSFEEVC